MNDGLEEFVLKNGRLFDDLEPKEELWNKVNRKLTRPKEKKPLFIFWKVAAVLLFMSTAYLIAERWQDRDEDKTVVLDEFIEVESYYASLISERRYQLNQGNEVLAKITFEELNELEEYYVLLKDDFQNLGSQERIVAALIQNLQLRMQLLNRQIHLLESKGMSNKRIHDEKQI
jgi:hypothetical protein